MSPTFGPTGLQESTQESQYGKLLLYTVLNYDAKGRFRGSLRNMVVQKETQNLLNKSKWRHIRQIKSNRLAKSEFVQGSPPLLFIILYRVGLNDQKL